MTAVDGRGVIALDAAGHVVAAARRRLVHLADAVTQQLLGLVEVVQLARQFFEFLKRNGIFCNQLDEN